MTVWHLQHHHAGDDMLEVPLGWTFGAIVSDCDMISKIRARQSTRNRLSIPRYYLTKGRGVRVRAGSVPPKTVPRQPPTPPYVIRVDRNSLILVHVKGWEPTIKIRPFTHKVEPLSPHGGAASGRAGR